MHRPVPSTPARRRLRPTTRALAPALGGALLVSLVACDAERGPELAPVAAGWLPALDPWGEGERERLPVSFSGGGVGLTVLLDLQPGGVYERAVNGCLGRLHEDSGTWAFVDAGVALEGGDPLPGARWLGAIELTPDGGSTALASDVLLVARSAADEWTLVEQSGRLLKPSLRGPRHAPSIWSSVRVDPLVEEARRSR